MTFGTQELTEALAFAGLVVGTLAYYALMRWRQERARQAELAARSRSQEHGRRRFRHLQRSDDV